MKQKDLFLACVRGCFILLTEFIRENMETIEGSDQIELRPGITKGEAIEIFWQF